MVFSIVIPVYNGEKYISKSIESVLGQSYPKWQLIIVNDGSCDNTDFICNQYLGDDRILYINKKNGGVSDSRNAGIQKATGEYIVFLDADDCLEKDCLLKFYNALHGERCDLLLANYYIVNKEEQIETPRIFKNGFVTDEKELKAILEFSLSVSQGVYKDWYGNIHSVWAKCYSRDFLSKHNISFTYGLKIGEDMVFNLHCMKNAKIVGLLDEYVYNYRDNDESVMHQQKWEGVQQGELYFNEAEKIVKSSVSEMALACLWLETAEMDWIRILNSEMKLKRKLQVLNELFGRTLYIRFSHHGNEFSWGKKQKLYMFAIRKNLPLLLLITLKLKVLKTSK